MTEHEVEQRLGYTPCICAKIDGTWHPECYRGKTSEEVAAGSRRAFAAARRYLKEKARQETLAIIAAAAGEEP